MTTYTFPNTNIGNTGNFANTDNNTFAKAGLLLDSSQQNTIVMDMPLPIPLPDPMYMFATGTIMCSFTIPDVGWTGLLQVTR